MLPYYEENGLIWDDSHKLELYRQCALWKIVDSEEVGFIMFDEQDSELFLAELHITDNNRNKGYGTKAIEMAKSYAVNAGHQKLVLQVFKNSPAYELYLRNGFTLESERHYTYRLVAKIC